jgi:GntR family transcriptional regulator, trigonelline degradation regulator
MSTSAEKSDSYIARIAAPVREQVEVHLRTAITSQRLVAGQRLVERELIEEFGVSRTTVREALRHLAAEGLVTTIPHKGVVVASPTRREQEELYELRALLEGFAGLQFVVRATPQHFEALREAFAEVERTWSDSGTAESIRAMIRSADRFYEVLFDGAGNATVASVLEQLQARISALRAASLSRPGRAEVSLRELRAIFEAVNARDPEAASQACSFHVEQAARVLFDVPEDSSPFGRSNPYQVTFRRSETTTDQPSTSERKDGTDDGRPGLSQL